MSKRNIRSFTNNEFKYLNAVTPQSIDDIKPFIRVNKDEGNVKMALERINGDVGSIRFSSPPMRAVYTGSLNGLGGQAKLSNGAEAKPKFTVMTCDAELYHPAVYEANSKLDIRANVKKQAAHLEDIYDVFIEVKQNDPTVHKTQYKQAKDTVTAMVRGKDTPPEGVLELLGIQMRGRSKKAFGPDSADVEKALKIAGAYAFKFSSEPFFKPKNPKDLRPVDKDIMEIYNKGQVDSNPDYVHAAGVVAKHKAGYNFNRMNVRHVDKNIKYPIFGPFFGQNSTIVVDYEVQAYDSGENDGMSLYIKNGILVLADEPYVPHDKEIATEYAAPKKREAEAGEDESAKKQKMAGEGDEEQVTTEYKTS